MAIFSKSGLFTKRDIRRFWCRMKSIHVHYAPTKRWNLSRRTPTSVCEVQPLTTQEWEERWESGAVENTHAQACMSPRFCTFRQDVFIWYVGQARDASYLCCHYSQLLSIQPFVSPSNHCKVCKACSTVFALYWKSTRESAINAQDSGDWLDFILIHTWKMALDRGGGAYFFEYIALFDTINTRKSLTSIPYFYFLHFLFVRNYQQKQ